jgi:hypothetical protein
MNRNAQVYLPLNTSAFGSHPVLRQSPSGGPAGVLGGKWRTSRPRRSPRSGTSADRRSPCLQDVDPGDNSTVFGRNRFPSCSPAQCWSGRDREAGRDSLKSDRFRGSFHWEGPEPPTGTAHRAGRLRSLSRSGPSATISTHCANPPARVRIPDGTDQPLHAPRARAGELDQDVR